MRIGMDMLDLLVELDLMLAAMQDRDVITALQEAVDDVRARGAGSADD
jgi:hypothetical protein